MSKRPRLSHPNNPKIWNGGTWYYCHKYTGGKRDGQYRKNKPSEFQVTMKSKPIHPNTIKGQGGDKSKSKTLKIASALISVIESDVEGK